MEELIKLVDDRFVDSYNSTIDGLISMNLL